MTDFSGFQFNQVQTIVLWAIPLLFAITVHEAAHGYAANRLGDPTAKMLGRLTLNPARHIDLVGTIILPALTVWFGGFIFGWAKPVPINWRKFKHIRRDTALVAMAGPLSNLVMAIMWAYGIKLGMMLENQHIIRGIVFEAMGRIGLQVNCILCLLNLLPLQPLDGGRIMSSILPGKLSYYFDKLEHYGIFILLFLMAAHLLSAILLPPLNFLMGVILGLTGLS